MPSRTSQAPWTPRVIPPEERDRWNEFVASSTYGHIYQSYEWGEFREAEGWRAHPLALEADGRLWGAALMLEKPLGRLGRSVFLVPRGPVVDYEDEARVSALWEAMEQTVRRNRGIFLRVSPEVRADAPRPPLFTHLRPARGELLHRCTFRLSLLPEIGEIRKRMEGRTRSAISRAAKRGVEVTSGSGEEDVARFHALLRETSARHGFRIQDEAFFRNLARVLGPSERVRVFVAEVDGRPVSGAVVLLFGRKSWYTWGGSSVAGRGTGANERLHWEILGWLRARGVAVYDLHGVACHPTPEDKTWGVYLFKRGFGGDFVEWVGEWDRVFSTLGYQAWRLAWAGYLGLANRVSRFSGLAGHGGPGGGG